MTPFPITAGSQCQGLKLRSVIRFAHAISNSWEEGKMLFLHQTCGVVQYVAECPWNKHERLKQLAEISGSWPKCLLSSALEPILLALHLRRSSSPDFSTTKILFVLPLPYWGHFPGVSESENFRAQSRNEQAQKELGWGLCMDVNFAARIRARILS